jgi:hypothetical protein
MSNADWFKYCFDWQIPTFALYMDGETAFQLETFNRNVKQAIQQGLVSYHNSMRSANTAYENACDQSDVAYTNTANAADTARVNAYNSADTARTNARNVADTTKTNIDNSTNTEYSNTDRICSTQLTNLGLANTGTAYNEEQSITVSDTLTYLSNQSASNSTTWANNYVEYTTDVDILKTSGITVANQYGTIASAALNGAQGGVMIGGATGASLGAVTLGTMTIPGVAVGAAVGGVVGAIGGSISAYTNGHNNGIVQNATRSACEAQTSYNTVTNSSAISFANQMQTENDSLKRVIYQNNATVSTNQMTNNNSTSRQNAADSRDTTQLNATNAKNTAYTNAQNSYDSSRTNALNTYNTTEANADRTRDNVQANSGYTREVAELNAKEILENGKYAAMAAVLDARNSAPIECCDYSGNPAPDYYRTRGIQIKVKTQSDSAIRQTGDTFARFGYALNQIWDVTSSGLKLMNHFTYWKATEIWVDSRDASNNSVNTLIRRMFMNGVTVWNDPTEIGKVNVYTN